MKQKSIVTLIATLAIIILTGAPVKANFLGLAPGDYTITLFGSTSLCTTNCTGTVHIGNPGATGFDWSFIIQGNNFFFNTTNDGDTSISPNGANTCAVEALVGLDDCTATNSSVTANVARPGFILFQFEDSLGSWFYFPAGEDQSSGVFFAAPLQVPEPASIALLSFGALGLYLRRRRQNR